MNPVPTISRIDPSEVEQGCPEFDLTITGTGFNEETQVIFHADTEQFYISPTILKIRVTPKMVKTEVFNQLRLLTIPQVEERQLLI